MVNFLNVRKTKQFKVSLFSFADVGSIISVEPSIKLMIIVGLTASELVQEGSSHVTSSKVGACSVQEHSWLQKWEYAELPTSIYKTHSRTQYSALILKDLGVFLSIASLQVS